MKNLFVEFGDMLLNKSETEEALSVSISAPVETPTGDFVCNVRFDSGDSISQKIFGMDSGDCLKAALIYIESVLESPESYLGGFVSSSDGGEELPIIHLKKNK